MGGQTFDNTIQINLDKYNLEIENIRKIGLVENKDYVFPFRLKNKIFHNDIDIILSDTDNFISRFEYTNKILEIKTIPLYEEKYSQYSKHILTTDYIQIDLLKSWNSDSIEITRAYYSYSIANIFLKRIATVVNKNFKFSYLGLFCTDNKYIIPPNIQYIQLDEKTRLIIDCFYVFNILDLNYQTYSDGFENEIELLDYFSKSKYFFQIKQFKNNSKFKHDYKRLNPFKNLVDSGLILVENFNHDDI